MKTFILALVALLASSAALVHAHPDGHGPRTGTRIPAPPLDTAYGREGDPALVTRTIEVEMGEASFKPPLLRVKQGETVKFVARNASRMARPLVIGTLKDLQDHAAMRKKFPGMVINQANQVLVEPGQSGELVWQFTRAGEFRFGSPSQAGTGLLGKLAVTAP